MPNLAMRQPGSQFSGDGIDLSWPIGGEREVLAVPDEDMTLRIRRRIAEGQIVITDDKPTKSADTDAREYKLLTGEEARKRMAEPAGPVTRVVYHPATPADEREFNLEVQSVEGESEIFKKSQAEAAAAAEEKSAAIAKAQAEAEKAALEAEKPVAVDVEPIAAPVVIETKAEAPVVEVAPKVEPVRKPQAPKVAVPKTTPVKKATAPAPKKAPAPKAANKE